MDALLDTPLREAARWILAAALEITALAAFLGFIVVTCLAMGGRA